MIHNRSTRAFGVEEEYQLLDARLGTPVNKAAEVIADLPTALRPQAQREYLSCLLETSTPVCHDAEAAESVLFGFRTVAAQVAAAHGIVLAGAGLPPVGGDTVGTVTPKPRYLHIEAEVQEAGRHQYATGTHVHVEVPSPDAGVEVIARIARWAPTLLAMTVNSPLWCGSPTGFASWRHIMARDWPAASYPEFENAEAYARAVTSLIGTGIVPDTGMLSWTIRLSANYPTVELRIADAQLAAGDAVAFAVMVRALVDRALRDHEAGAERPHYATGMVNGANWMAARDGLTAELIDPLLATRLPAFEMVDRLVASVEDELERSGDRARVDRYVRGLRQLGDPASRQLNVFERTGIAGTLELYRSSFVTDLSAPPSI